MLAETPHDRASRAATQDRDTLRPPRRHLPPPAQKTRVHPQSDDSDLTAPVATSVPSQSSRSRRATTAAADTRDGQLQLALSTAAPPAYPHPQDPQQAAPC